MNHFIKAERTDEMTYRALLQEARDGNLIKIRNGVYGTIDSLTGGMIDIEKIIPGGIICLYSAWHIYHMTTQIPDAFYVAINRKRGGESPGYVGHKTCLSIRFHTRYWSNTGRNRGNKNKYI